MELKEKICQDLKVGEQFVNNLLINSSRNYILFKIPKNNGGYRIVAHPINKLKMLQYWLIQNIFQNMTVSDKAFAYQGNLSILDNAKYHSKNKYFLKLDLKDYFLSIRSEDFIYYLREWHNRINPNWPLNHEAISLISDSCFLKNGKLPMGFCSSPIISNIVMYRFDQSVEALLVNNDMQHVKYSRYADDITLSMNEKGLSKEIYSMVKVLIESTLSPNIQLNDAKTKFVSAKGGSAIVTGLRITCEQKVTLHKKIKDKVRLYLSLYRKDVLSKDDFTKLLGYLSFVRHTEPDFYSKLQLKYFAEIAKLKEDIKEMPLY